MILSDREIMAALARQAIRIMPAPSPEMFSSTAVDLTLGRELQVWRNPAGAGIELRIRPGSTAYSVKQVLDQLTERVVIGEAGYPLLPGEFVLGWTAQRVQLPHRSRLAARLEGKSSLARLGLGVHVTAPTIHAGFGIKQDDPQYEGTTIQLEIWNIGKVPIVLDAGIPICQLVFEVVDGTPEKGYSGQFTIQGPQLPDPTA